MAVAHELEAPFYSEDWTIGFSLDRAIQIHRRHNAGQVYVASDGTEVAYTFEELRDAAWERGLQLLAMGLEKGDHVGIIVPDPQDFVLTFLGAACVGIVSIPLYPPLGFGKLDSYVRDTARIMTIGKAKALVTSKQVQPVLWSLMSDVPTLEQLVTVEKVKEQVPAPRASAETVDPDDICFLQFTSGSTAAPKGVIVSHRSLGANTQHLTEHGIGLGQLETDVSLSWLPLYHDMGLIGMVIGPICCGMHSVLVPTLTFIKRPSRWMELMSKHEATISFAPNFAYGLSMKRTRPEGVAEMKLSQVRILGCGAEPNHPGTLRAFADHFAPAGLNPNAIMPVYGMAEATLAMSFTRQDEPMRTDVVCAETYAADGTASPIAHVGDVSDDDTKLLEFVSCGETFPNHEIVVVDDDGTPLPNRTVGEIVFRGPSVAPGYYDNPDATGAAFTSYGLRTGDMGYLANGELFVTGRKKDVVILNGRNYDPHSIEWVVAEIAGLRKGNVVVFSVPGAQSEQLVIAAEVKRGVEQEGLDQRVRSVVREEFSLSPADIVLLDAGTLPKTTSGKLQRRKTRDQYIAGVLGVEGVRTMGDKGDKIVLARHVAKSAISRVRHSVKRRLTTTLRARAN